ncbi:hypothetical protein MH928_13735 [Flavobacterium sp. WW92]|uniref:hypothetical protein n=1 Tax=unclassified Flavobacterium TaxID=196869 RepID=UPI002223FCD8|nr:MULTISPECIES: hypothetical protein [unclassified Flavobacterium]WDO12380.1 hypothetical protein MH928_13735 [Flavobacterium sp. WW92]
MIDYDKSRKLALQLDLYRPYKKRTRTILDKEMVAQSPDLIWGASVFCAKVLLKSSQQQFHTLLRSDLPAIQKDFEDATGKTIDLDKLFSKGWLCEVFNIIEVPSAVNVVARHTGKVSGLYSEYLFFTWIKANLAENKTKISSKELSDFAAQYSADNGCTINLQKSESHFWHEKEGEVVITLHPVHESIFQNIDDFLFIKVVIDATKEQHIYIEESTLLQIHNDHTAYFPHTPTLKELVNNQVFILLKEKTKYTVNLRFNEFKQLNSCADRYAAILWDYLLLDDTFKDDNDRLFFWYSRLVHNEDYVDIEDSFYGQAKDRFIAAAMQVILLDRDTQTGFNEYLKVYLDALHARLDHFELAARLDPSQEYFSPSEDPFEIFDRILQLNKSLNDDTMLAGLKTRRPLSYFISQIVKNDSSHQFKNTVALLKMGQIKPYVFYKACFNIYYWNPHIIPFLVHDKLFCSLSFLLISKTGVTSFTGNEGEAIYASLLKEQFELIVEFCASNHDISVEEKAKIVFQCLLKATIGKYKVKGNERLYRIAYKRKNQDRSETIRNTFEKTILGTVHHTSNKRYRLPLYTQLLKALLENIKAYEPYDIYKRGDLYMPFVKFDLLNYLLVLSNEKVSLPETEKTQDLTIDICSAFTDIYTRLFTNDSILCLDYEHNSLKSDIPSWRSSYINEETLDISDLLLHLENTDHLDDFLSDVRFRFSNSKDQYDIYNRFQAERLRTHLNLLLQAYNVLYRKINAITELPVSRTIDRLESKITSIVKLHCVFEPARRRYDIFNIYLERYFTDEQEQLLPVIGMVLNKFKALNRKLIVDELIKKDQIVRALKLLDYIVSENESRNLLQSIIKLDIESTMKNLEYMDLHYVVGKLLLEPTFLENAEKALAIAEQRLIRLSGGTDKETNLLYIFRNKLLLSYQKGGTEAIKQIDALVDHRTNSSGRKGNSTDAEKDFYRALIYFNQGDGEKAYNTYNKLLTYDDGEKPVLALNRFASKIKWAQSSKDPSTTIKLYKEALEEWNEFENTEKNKEQWQNITENILYNKLQAADGLDDNIEFDKYYNSLENEMQLRKDFLTIRVNNLIKRDMIVQAEFILTKAQEYHRLETAEIPNFIYELIKLTRPEETIEHFKRQYLRIISNAPEELIKIIPNNVNEGATLELFILHEIVGSANGMLRLVNSISTINYEDKFTDLILLALNSRIRNYHWYATTDRGGFAHDDDRKKAIADSKHPNPGEIDFSIFSANNDKLACVEALVVEGKNTQEVQKHVLKIFNYDHARKLFYIIVYYKGRSANYKKAWKSYKSVVDDFIEFPNGYAIVGRFVEEINGYGANDSLKIGQTVHENGTILYHIFININYKLELIEKMVKDDKPKKK